MLIAVPSMARAATHMERLFLHKLPLGWKAQSALFVPKAEFGAYTAQVNDIKIVPIPDKVKGIIRTRRWIGEYAKQHNHAKFVMCDDDLIFHTRINKDDYHLRKSTDKQLGEMFFWIEKTLSKHAQVGISAREGNNRPGVGDVSGLTVLNTRLLRVYGYQTEVFLKACIVKEVPEWFTMDDFHVTLKLLRSGHSNAMTYWWANGQRVTQDVGGASTYRTLDTHNKSAHLLAEMHPGLVRLVQKDNKTNQNGLQTRTEAVMSWKRAYEEGQGK